MVLRNGVSGLLTGGWMKSYLVDATSEVCNTILEEMMCDLKDICKTLSMNNTVGKEDAYQIRAG